MTGMGTTYGLLLFDDMEELDFAGPWEVFGAAASVKPEDRVVAIAERDSPVRAAKGLRVLPDCTFGNAPPLDVLPVQRARGAERAAIMAEGDS